MSSCSACPCTNSACPRPSSHRARGSHVSRYDNGPVGLIGGKKAFVLAARGGLYAGTPRDTQTQYVCDFLALLRMNEVEFVYAEWLAVSNSANYQSVARANALIDRLHPQDVAALA